MNPNIGRQEHFFAYMPYADTDNAVPVQDSVIGCQKVKADIDGKSRSVVVFTRIPMSDFKHSALAKKSAAKAIEKMGALLKIAGVSNQGIDNAIKALRHRPDGLNSVEALGTKGFEDSAVARLGMPMIASLDQLDEQIQSAESIYKKALKNAFEADPIEGGSRPVHEEADFGEISKTENPNDDDVGLRIIKKSVKVSTSLLKRTDVKGDSKPKKTES